MPRWQCLLERDSQRRVIAGSEAALCAAIGRGADLRVGTAFRHNEHIDTASDNPELIREQMDFRVTYLLQGRWAGGIETLRMPVSLPDSFGPWPSLSFFLYNQDGTQAVGRPFFDGQQPTAAPGPSPAGQFPDMPKMHELSVWDEGTNAPSRNFIYDFEYFRFFARDCWEEVLAHDDAGRVLRGSVEELARRAATGSEVKVAIAGLCRDLPAAAEMDHEVFVHLGPCYYYSDRRLFIGGANPLVRIAPAMPLAYRSGNWDFGWVLPRSDGQVARWLCDPYSLAFHKSETRHALRWFVEKDQA